MAVKYVKDFFFGPMTSVQRYAKGGHVTKVPAKAKDSAKGMPARAKPNAPAKGAKRMESPPKMGKGQGYKDGGKVDDYGDKKEAYRGSPKKAEDLGRADREESIKKSLIAMDLAKARRLGKTYNELHAEERERGYKEGALSEDAYKAGRAYEMYTPKEVRKMVESDPEYFSKYAKGGKVPGKKMDRQPTKTPPGREKDLAPAKPFKGAYEGYAKGGRMRRYAEGGDTDGDTRAARIMPGDGAPVSPLNQYGEMDPYAGRPVRDISVSPYEGRMEPPLERSPYMPVDESSLRPDPGYGISFDEYYSGRQAPMLIEEPPMARAVREAGAGRAVGLSDIMRAARAQGMMGRPVAPTAMYAKGGKVSKGQAKVGKVMSEYKAGELHSGSKKGPLVKNPKQAVAIALSEARKSGAKIPRKEEGGLMASKPEVRKPKSVTVTKVTKTVSDAKDAALNEKKMLEFLRSLPKDEIADMMEKRAMQAPSMDPDMPKYRKGGMARKGVPAHKAKAMYGGGKC